MQQLDGPVRQHLVGVHVVAGAGAGLEGVDPEAGDQLGLLGGAGGLEGGLHRVRGSAGSKSSASSPQGSVGHRISSAASTIALPSCLAAGPWSCWRGGGLLDLDDCEHQALFGTCPRWGSCGCRARSGRRSRRNQGLRVAERVLLDAEPGRGVGGDAGVAGVAGVAEIAGGFGWPEALEVMAVSAPRSSCIRRCAARARVCTAESIAACRGLRPGGAAEVRPGARPAFLGRCGTASRGFIRAGGSSRLESADRSRRLGPARLIGGHHRRRPSLVGPNADKVIGFFVASSLPSLACSRRLSRCTSGRRPAAKDGATRRRRHAASVTTWSGAGTLVILVLVLTILLALVGAAVYNPQLTPSAPLLP